MKNVPLSYGFINPESQEVGSLDEFLKNYVEVIYWVKSVAFVVMPKDFATWLFSVPALAYFPTRIVMSAVIGWWALKKASVLKVRDRNRITIA